MRGPLQYGPSDDVQLPSARRANESIPSPRRRVKIEPQEQSLRFPCCNLTCREAGLAFVLGHLTSSPRTIIKVAKTIV
jgi:hypothetical protein